MAALNLQITSLVSLSSDFPGHPTFARYGDLTARVEGGTIRRVGEGGKSSAELSLFKIEHCVFAEWDVLSEEIVEVV